MECKPIDVSQVPLILWSECSEQFPHWGRSANWSICKLEEGDFQKLLVFNGGEPASLWQKFANGSYEIAKVAKGLLDYNGRDSALLQWKQSVLNYEKRMDNGEFPTLLCLVRVKEGPMTLFETNRRALALYLHYFEFKKRSYQPINALLAEVTIRLPLQSQ